MKIFAPDYYKDFSCIADKCRHSCCIGWEIDIDDKSLKKYNSISGKFAQRLKENIKKGEECSYFKLSGNERCPFLNENNLCDIFINLGEDYLCQICTDHPRFRNFFDSRIEIGLGLTCEEAARLIVTNEKKVCLTEIQADENETSSNDDEVFFSFRENIFNLIQDRSMTINDRILTLLSRFDIKLPENTIPELADIFLGFEQMDKTWTNMLLKLKSLKQPSNSILFSDNFSIATEQLLVYFLYRHLSDAVFDGKFKERIAFACFSVMMIDYLAYSHFSEYGSFKTSDLLELSRLYSSEIEYSEESLDFLLNDFFTR